MGKTAGELLWRLGWWTTSASQRIPLLKGRHALFEEQVLPTMALAVFLGPASDGSIHVSPFLKGRASYAGAAFDFFAGWRHTFLKRCLEDSFLSVLAVAPIDLPPRAGSFPSRFSGGTESGWPAFRVFFAAPREPHGGGLECRA